MNEERTLTQQFQRLLFINVNKYQQQILIPALILCLFSCIGAIYSIYYVNYIDQNVAVLCKIDTFQLTHDVPWFIRMHSLNKVVPWVLFGMTTLLLIIVCWLFIISNKLLGPSTRILRELDQILSGERTDPIGTRPGDEFFKELLKRINLLIKKTQ